MKDTSTSKNQGMVAVGGKTFPVKELIKALGGIWNPTEKVWMVPADRAQGAQRLVNQQQGVDLTNTSGTGKSFCESLPVKPSQAGGFYNQCVLSTPETQVQELERMFRLS